MRAQVFYSWQSDTAAALGREFIRRALSDAIADLAADAALVVRPELALLRQNIVMLLRGQSSLQ